MYFKLAIAQHPMYFLIKMDSICAERTPPWGAADIETYIERIRENIAILKKYPQLKVGYEWSALELELLKEDAPDVFQHMLEMVKTGKSTLYNGTYSQPHLQTLSSESNYRQFEVGLRTYRQLCDHEVLTYAHQECSLNEQTPQLLKAFGIKNLPLPNFISTIVMEGGEQTFHENEGSMFVNGSEFTQWRGLDGTLIDVYLKEPPHRKIKDWMDYQEVKGMLHVPPIFISIPDMIAVDDQWVADRAKADFVLLDEILPERLKKYPPRFQSRIFTNWSYIEGICAEELSRQNFLAEQSVLRAEALNAMAFLLLGREPSSTDSIWKTILATQHHDVYCFCGPEIRAKCINWLKTANVSAAQMTGQAATDIMAQILPLEGADHQIVVFNTLPHPIITPVSIEIPLANPVVLDGAGQPVPCQVIPAGDGTTRVSFMVNPEALGYASFAVKAGEIRAQRFTKINHEYEFGNSYYSCVVNPDGTFSALNLPGGKQLLDSLTTLGNQLAGTDSTGLGSKHEGVVNIPPVANATLENPVMWEPPKRGPDLKFTPLERASILENLMGSTFKVNGQLNDQIKAELRISFYKQLPRIDFEWEFQFDHASIGSFYDDETKLRVQWPLAYQGKIEHDIAFGVVPSFEERPFLPANWVDVADGEKGLAYFHQGTIKHWVKDQILVNLFAWGEETDAIGNRLGMKVWPKTFDQRLNGTHIIRYSIYPHPGDWRSADVIGIARGYHNPPVALLKPAGQGSLPVNSNLFQIANPNLVATAFKPEGADVLCRLYSVSQKDEPVSLISTGANLQGIYSLTGEDLKNLAPFKIGKIVLKAK